MYGMNPFSRSGYNPTGTTGRMLKSTNDAEREQGENLAFAYGRDHDQQEHEKGLQAQEQKRRAYDSETARMGQQAKFSVLGDLLRNRPMV